MKRNENNEPRANQQQQQHDMWSPTANIDDVDDGQNGSVTFSEIYNETATTTSVAEGPVIAADSSTGNNNNNNNGSSANNPPRRHYSVKELVHSLGHDSSGGGAASAAGRDGNPELERRCMDFRLAQRKRRDKYGASKPWGFFGMYQHLSSVRMDLEWAEDAAWRRQHGQPYLSWADFDAAFASSSGRRRPLLTYALIAICTLLMVVEFAVNDWNVEPLSVNPMLGPSRETLIRVGARDSTLIVAQNEWYRLVSPLILHAGIIHFAINMLALWFIGAAIELSHGMLNTLVLFLVPGIGGNLLSALFLPQYISVGASGGIFGLMGGCLADIGLNWRLLFLRDATDETEAQLWRRNFLTVFMLVAEIGVNIVRL
jgi:membrane associated rhomboid family serine protease